MIVPRLGIGFIFYKLVPFLLRKIFEPPLSDEIEVTICLIGSSAIPISEFSHYEKKLREELANANSSLLIIILKQSFRHFRLYIEIPYCLDFGER
jgi:hypothetical protein